MKYQKYFKKIQPTCCGHDNISMKLLQFLSQIISKPLTILINQSISTSIFPDKAKIAKILPLHKRITPNLLQITDLCPFFLAYQK